MTWVANELLLDKKYFYLECMRIPPDWHLWVYILGTEKEASEFQVSISSPISKEKYQELLRPIL